MDAQCQFVTVVGGVGTVGGTPTTAAEPTTSNQTVAVLPGMGGNPGSGLGFAFLNSTTVYVADPGTTGDIGGIDGMNRNARHSVPLRGFRSGHGYISNADFLKVGCGIDAALPEQHWKDNCQELHHYSSIAWSLIWFES